MNSPNISRRAFIRILSGLFAFVPVAKSLTTFPVSREDIALQRLPLSPTRLQAISPDDVKAKIAKGEVLNLEGNSIWIRDKYVDRLRLVVTDESIVWKGKYNRGKDFQSYPHIIEPGDIAIARGERRENEFIVERMYANIANIYVTVNEINIGTEEITISFTDTSNRKGIAKVRQDYLIDKAIHAEVAASRQRLRGTIVQIIGLPLRDGTIIASNVLF